MILNNPGRYLALPLILTSLAIITACARPIPAIPTPQPAPPNETTEAPPSPPTELTPESPKNWTFTYSIGTFPYTIITEAEIAQLPDTLSFRAIPQTTQYVQIGVADSGIFVISPPPPETFKCDSTASLFTRAQQLIPPLPQSLSAGDSWSDSTTTEGCRGTIPVTTTLIHEYTIAGDTILGPYQAVLIRRTERITAKGEGHEGQHRILLSATGTGTTNLYIDPASGRLLEAKSQQNTLVAITTSGRVSQFLQNVHERVVLTDTEASERP